ncbi:putative linoleate 9S-lipoxygenase 5 [Iris pallida]|uniref:Lipoxygenase n=1 Tax=Iris pallida TaxID=29817 RepID=A0AAX6I300_IRIPA|nr:putative linoleate 9S-lipoxygenase 5 [Iris pallida]
MSIHSVVDSIKEKLLGAVGGDHSDTVKIKATVVLMKKNFLDFNDFNASIIDDAYELLGRSVSFQLVSSVVGDPNKAGRGVMGEPAYLEKWISTPTPTAAGESVYSLTFEWDEGQGAPGAVVVKNHHPSELYLKSMTIENFPTVGRIHFVCNSWVYPVKCYNYDRVFFTNRTYLSSNTPEPLKQYREEELMHLRGDDVTGELQKHDRVYGYAYYNDLGEPEKGQSYARPVLGGSAEYPYPRRGRTSRPPNKADPNSESRLPILQDLDIYVPRDERFGHLKLSDFLGNAIKAVGQALLPVLEALLDQTPLEFGSFHEVLQLYEGGVALPNLPKLGELRDSIPFELIKDILPTPGERLFRLPTPQIIQEDKLAWRTDEEFVREMVAGINPVIISRLQEFPPTSKLDPNVYGNHESSITAADIENNMEGFTVSQALEKNRLFILDHHDTLILYVSRINSDTSSKIYASRTLLFLRDDSTLKPLAIELSLPHPGGERHGSVSQVFTPAEGGVEGSIWQLAKAYVAVNDSGVHQLISHWLNTHAVIEPFVVATNRQLSVMHPIYKLLSPHYRDTMNINALARQILINAGGILEATVFPGKYAMELSAVTYKNWKFTEQALPADLLKRGVAVEDSTQPNNIRLLIRDYPYANDGLAIWSAIETWVADYCSIYYADDAAVRSDDELQAWWAEVREVGHGDKKDEPWWPALDGVRSLTRTLTTVVWVASALHAAVNFGQYPYAGYLPNRPTMSRRLMPQPGTAEYEELRSDPDRAFLRTVTSQLQTILGVSLIEILSKHSSDEVYLGQRDTAEWTDDGEALAAFGRFGEALVGIEKRIAAMNGDGSLKNRNGPVKVPYTLLYPSTSDYSKVGGLTGRGIPNSTSL